MIFKGWDIKCHPLFAEILTSLYQLVSELRDTDPVGYRTHPKARLLARVYKLITEDIPENPSNPRYFQGNTLGKDYREWKRAKFERHRLFFKYSSDRKMILDAWLNDEDTLRKAGSSTDPYKVFKHMLDRKVVQDDFPRLEMTCMCPWSDGKQLIPAQLN